MAGSCSQPVPSERAETHPRTPRDRFIGALLVTGLTVLVSMLTMFFTDRVAFGERSAHDAGQINARMAAAEKQLDHKADLKDLKPITEQLTRIEEQLRELRADVKGLERAQALERVKP